MKFLKLILLLVFAVSFGQKGFVISDAKKTVIPFQFINNLIFIPVNINGVDLTFLLDSGVNETILFSLDNKQINFNNVEKIKFSGLGESINIEGLKSENNTLNIGKNFKDSKHTIFIILEESINFSSHVGIPVNGIIGYQFFKNHPIQIDYSSKKITVYNDDSYEKKLKKFKEFPITIEGNKPYTIADVEMTDTKAPSKLLLDLGNSDALWLFPTLIKDFVYHRPNIDDYLGQGFNGDIFGKRSRIHHLYLGDFTFEKPLVAMPEEYSIQHLKIVPDRKGSIGSEILRRFTVIFDYKKKKIHLKANRFYNDPFLFNKSGLDIQHDGLEWEKSLMNVETKKHTQSNEVDLTDYVKGSGFQYNFVLKPKFSVAGCRKDSPCFKAGVRKDDKIISINGTKAGYFTLQRIYNLLKEEGDGSIVSINVERDGEILNFKITLEDPIPY